MSMVKKNEYSFAIVGFVEGRALSLSKWMGRNENGLRRNIRETVFVFRY